MPSGLFMGLSSTLIYTSELILCSTIFYLYFGRNPNFVWNNDHDIAMCREVLIEELYCFKMSKSEFKCNAIPEVQSYSVVCA